jgi:protein gp37
MCDVFEDRPELEAPRRNLFDLIEETPSLIWMLLTKRPENVQWMAPWTTWLANIWLGVSAENQAWATERIPLLLDIPARIHFLSAEPLLGPLDLSACGGIHCPGAEGVLDWVIVGGESGAKHRPMELAWLANIVTPCRELHVPVFVKQDAGRKPGVQGRIPDELWIQELPDGGKT